VSFFAPGTNRDYANAYDNWWFGQNGRGPAPQRSSFGPDSPAGRAQPVQPQSQGTPYGQSPARPSEPYAAYRPQAGASGQQQGGAFSAYQTPPSSSMGGGPGNFAYASPDQRPAPFTSTTRGPDGQQYDPSQYYPMRDAFIQNINDARSQFVSNPGAGRQPMDFGAMWGQAGDMAQSGYTNPLTSGMGGSPMMGGPAGSRSENWSPAYGLMAPPGGQQMGYPSGPFGESALGALAQQSPPSQYPQAPGGPASDDWKARAIQARVRAWYDPSNPNAPSRPPRNDSADRWAQYRQEDEVRRRTQEPPAPPPRPAYAGRESEAQRARRGQLLHAVDRDGGMNGWQFKNMDARGRADEMRRRREAIMAASPQEIERMAREGRFPTPGRQSRAGYRGALTRAYDD
jgi:hypothetical protein